MKGITKLLLTMCGLLLLLGAFRMKYSKIAVYNPLQNNDPWPVIQKEMHPWTRWWWMGSAVDEKNLDRLLTSYSKAGFGGVEVTPIYGAIGFEKRYIDFLSPQWMNMLNYTVEKASSLGMGVDMNTGTGWPFGGPQVTMPDAASKLIIQSYITDPSKPVTQKIVVNDEKQLKAGAQLQAVTAYSEDGQVLSLLDKVDNNGNLNWKPSSGKWQVYAAFCGKTLQMVKRAAAGGEGLVMDHLNKTTVNNYLKRFDEAFAGKTPGIRAFFDDSYEVYNANWTPGLFDEFRKRKGYDLRLYLKQLAGNDPSEESSRVKSDYRETVSQLLEENLAMNWTNWAHNHHKVTKYQAHGSPGNLLDLYSAADIPECEAYFGLTYFPIPGLRHDTADVLNPGSNANVFKFATSAAHNYDKPLVSSETFVWLTDHFKTSLSQCKPEVERLFLAGVNHVFYHGTTYSPDDIAFPGWQFYAASNFTPTNSLWPQLNGLNDYIARCQSVLQAGKPDNELLVYWPMYDCWANPRGTDMQISMHNVNEWLTPTAFNSVVNTLQDYGYSLDYISDKMLDRVVVKEGDIKVVPSAPAHKILIVPACNLVPANTMERIKKMAEEGATVIFMDLPKDVPGLNYLVSRRDAFKNTISGLFPANKTKGQSQKIGKGRIVLSQDIVAALKMLGCEGEALRATGLEFIRRTTNDGKYYYIVNHTAKNIDEVLPFNLAAGSVLIMDPQSTAFGLAPSIIKAGKTYVRIQLAPGEALILKCVTRAENSIPAWKYIEKYNNPVMGLNNWSLHFTEGGPELPSDQKLQALISWAKLPDARGISFSGTGEYSTTFEVPGKPAKEYILDLGTVDESAHVWINGQDAGILWSIPFRSRIGRFLIPGHNTIKIEVVNLMANRIRDMDIKGIKWRNYHEINFVNNNYKPFDASKWDPQPSGLLGPVTITPVE